MRDHRTGRASPALSAPAASRALQGGNIAGMPARAPTTPNRAGVRRATKVKRSSYLRIEVARRGNRRWAARPAWATERHWKAKRYNRLRMEGTWRRTLRTWGAAHGHARAEMLADCRAPARRGWAATDAPGTSPRFRCPVRWPRPIRHRRSVARRETAPPDWEYHRRAAE